jgi:hypothetical protein
MPQDHSFNINSLKEELGNEFEPGEEFEEEDFEEIRIEGVPEKPSFPIIIFIFAVIIDLFKLLSLGFFGPILFIFGWILVRVYLQGKISFIKRYVWKKALAHSIKNIFPLVSAFLGSWSYFIFRAHSKNYQRIDQILRAIEKSLTNESLT